MICANCGSSSMEIGESGAPTCCAQCGGRRFVRKLTPRDVLTAPEKIKALPPGPEAAALFSQIHDLIDRKD